MALNSMFFERTLADIGKSIEVYQKDGGYTDEDIGYLKGQAFLCFRIYKQAVYNPRLLEIATKRLDDIEELAGKLKKPEPKKTTRRKKNEKSEN